MTMGQRTPTACPKSRASVKTRHFGVQTTFIDKNQAADIPCHLLAAPFSASLFNIGAILLGGAQSFFYSLTQAVPSDATAR